MTYLFVGERPSRRAVQIGASWQNGKLAAKTLHEALLACNLSPSDQLFKNLYLSDKRGDKSDATSCRASLELIRRCHADGFVIVGMGALVSKVLRDAGITHLSLIHPAARGAIRKKPLYIAHVKETLAVGS